LHDISHELRSPLARLNVALALARQRTGPAAQSTLDRIELEAERLNELIGDLLTIARLENGKDMTHETPVHLAALVEGIADDADFEGQSRKCRVKAQIDQDCVVLGHENLLRSAIENVVRNGARYTAEGTTVNVRLTCSHSASPEAVIQVSDSGPGVPEDSLDKLFRPFYRIDDARVRGTGGVGLGLAITDRAVRLHNGSVKAANRPEGGLLVEIRIPRLASFPAESKLLVESPAG
jgi:signal transduction histidine kinase